MLTFTHCNIGPAYYTVGLPFLQPPSLFYTACEPGRRVLHALAILSCSGLLHPTPLQLKLWFIIPPEGHMGSTCLLPLPLITNLPTFSLHGMLPGILPSYQLPALF